MSKKRRKEQVILVTGGAGYVGSRLIRDLANDSRFPSCIIRIYDNLQRHHLCGLMDLPSKHRYEFIEGDILDRMTLTRAMQGTDAVIHLAAVVKTPLSYDHPEWTKQVNHWGTANVVSCALQAGVPNMIYSSSTSVYGLGGPFREEDTCHPVGPYSISKHQGEVEVLQACDRGLQALVVRLGTVFGNAPGMRFDAVVSRLAYLVGIGKPMVIHGNGEQTRPLIHVVDASAALRTCLATGMGKDRVINAATMNPSVNEVAMALRKLVPKAQIQYTEQDVLAEASFRVDSTKLTKLGFKPAYGLEKGLKDILERWQGFRPANLQRIPTKWVD